MEPKYSEPVSRTDWRPAAKLMLYDGSARFFGPGPADLLAAVRDSESIKEAAAATGISYAKARQMLDRLEEHLGYSVVDRKRGGSGGGQASLTGAGERLLEAWRAYTADVQRYVEESYREQLEPVLRQGESGRSGESGHSDEVNP